MCFVVLNKIKTGSSIVLVDLSTLSNNCVTALTNYFTQFLRQFNWTIRSTCPVPLCMLNSCYSSIWIFINALNIVKKKAYSFKIKQYAACLEPIKNTMILKFNCKEIVMIFKKSSLTIIMYKEYFIIFSISYIATFLMRHDGIMMVPIPILKF